MADIGEPGSITFRVAQLHALAEQLAVLPDARCREIDTDLRNLITMLELVLAWPRGEDR